LIAHRALDGRMARLAYCGVVLAAVGCRSARYGGDQTEAPSMVLPIHVAEGNTGKRPAPPPDAGAGASATEVGPSPSAESRARSALPDPEPISTAHQWEYDLVYEKGGVHVAGLRKIDLPKAVATARRIGRFAVELWIGKELVDRVRFDFPALATEGAPPEGVRKHAQEPIRVGPGAVSRQRVRVPDSDRATSAVLVDRLSGVATPLDWPPTPTPEPAPVSSGASHTKGD
jgi:hypothetical protein